MIGLAKLTSNETRGPFMMFSLLYGGKSYRSPMRMMVQGKRATKLLPGIGVSNSWHRRQIMLGTLQQGEKCMKKIDSFRR